jgi:protein arginine kinase activator
MLCDNCRERDAVVHLTQIVENAVTQLHLCEKCAAAKGVETTVAVPKHPLGEFLHQVQQQGAAPAGRGDAARCHFCSSTMKDFRATGRLGCAHCYQAFETSLRDLLRRVHNSGRHIGRRYEPPTPPVSETLSLLGELRQRLRRAIENEEFELAADLRDRIRVLE